jgi:hypothetical protein
MKRPVLALLMTFATVFAQDDRQNPPPLPGWHADLAAGMKEAGETGKPLLVVFR